MNRTKKRCPLRPAIRPILVVKPSAQRRWGSCPVVDFATIMFELQALGVAEQDLCSLAVRFHHADEVTNENRSLKGWFVPGERHIEDGRVYTTVVNVVVKSHQTNRLSSVLWHELWHVTEYLKRERRTSYYHRRWLVRGLRAGLFFLALASTTPAFVKIMDTQGVSCTTLALAYVITITLSVGSGLVLSLLAKWLLGLMDPEERRDSGDGNRPLLLLHCRGGSVCAALLELVVIAEAVVQVALHVVFEAGNGDDVEPAARFQMALGVGQKDL